MTDPKAFYAKLVLEREDAARPTVYEFKARSAGSGWVGFGLHVYGRGALPGRGYGGADSLLVWVTSDPAANGDDAPRLEVYKSRGPVDMEKLLSVRLDGSAYASRAYRVEYDPGTGSLAVFVDGREAARLENLKTSGDSTFAALRALDRAEFSDLRIYPLGPQSGSTRGTP